MSREPEEGGLRMYVGLRESRSDVAIRVSVKYEESRTEKDACIVFLFWLTSERT